MDPGLASTLAQRLIRQVGSVLVDKEEVIERAAIAFFASGHLLVEDVPGVGKTTLARAMAASLGLTFRRVQFTSDLMPADVLGGNVFDRETSSFRFRPGPIFTQVLLADEINRTTPRTQSALLEAMGEGQVSIDGTTHDLEEPFFVVATQNPQDFYGTYPLPESQLDRFLLRTSIGYPSRDDERQVLATRRQGDPIASLEALASPAELTAARGAIAAVKVADPVLDYLHDLVIATRTHSLLEVGASTRAALAFESAVRARAMVQGRDYAVADDVKALAVPVLAHRVRPRGAKVGRFAAEQVMRELLDELSVPI